MSTQVTVTLPDEIYRRAERLAELMHRDITDVLTDTITLSLPSLASQTNAPQPVNMLTDAEVLALSELQMEPGQDRRLSLLLERHQADLCSETERAELSALMQIYQEGLLRKAQAIQEAVRRGLRNFEGNYGNSDP
jgi:hypothetical protein